MAAPFCVAFGMCIVFSAEFFSKLLPRLALDWAHQDSNLGPTGYEPVALPAELWAHSTDTYIYKMV